MTTALEITVTAPITSFRNLLYPSVQVTLPCPPPSTVGGLLAAMVGGWQHVPTRTRVAMAFTTQGTGVDLETYHPLDARGTKRDATPKNREFLTGATLTLWMLDDVDLWERAVRRPVWPLRLGRSQDLASARTRRVVLEPGPGTQGSAILPVEMSTSGQQLRMPHTISVDRARVQWGTYRYASSGSPSAIDAQWHTEGGQAVVPLNGLHPQSEQDPVALPHVWAKSPAEQGVQGEALTTHLLATTHALDQLHARVGTIPGIPERFWIWARLACLFHDAGKVPAGFQRMVGNPAPAEPWGQRHEIYSLGFVLHVLSHLTEEDRLWIGLGVLTHHRPLSGGERSIRKQRLVLATPEQIATGFGPVDQPTATHVAQWLADQADAPAPEPATEATLAQSTDRLLEHLLKTWERGESPDESSGLVAALLQGAVTLADHVASANGHLLSTHPLASTHYPSRLRARFALKGQRTYPHQERAEHAGKYTAVRAPTGQGKTEAALLWATAQTNRLAEDAGATPRLFYALPYLASINAMADRLGEDLGRDHVGVVHSRSASFHLSRAACDEEASSQVSAPDEYHDREERARASRAVAKANASRLFRELVRVTTPYQLLRGALGGTAHAATLIDTANSVFVFDELHAYEPARLGMILAMMNQWAKLGGRIGILSATIPDRLLTEINTAIGQELELIEPQGEDAWPRRHRLHLRSEYLTSSESVDEIKQSLEAGRSVAVIANNVADAWNLYEQLAPLARDLHGEDAALLLHSRFKTGDRAQIEERLHERFGTGKQPRRPGLLVATQVVEVSLDVDFDILHTSAAPLEALLQRFGRINRVGHLPEPAPVVVHSPQYGPRGRTGPEFADKVYAAEPTALAWDILTRHHGHVLDERLFTSWLNEVYDSDWGTQWRHRLDESRRRFQSNFLSFQEPLNDNTELTETFDELFDGVDGIDIEDREAYKEALSSRTQGEERGTGRLLASQFLIPLPHYARGPGTWDRELGVLVINADYDAEHGLKGIRPVSDSATSGYRPGEVL